MLRFSTAARVIATVTALFALHPRIANAQPPVSDAERAFQEGLSLYDAGKISEACTKFGQSFAIDPTALGTLQNMAACHEREGKRAQALREWLDLAARAQQAAKAAQEALARQHVVDLSTRLPRVMLQLDPNRAHHNNNNNNKSSGVVTRVELDGESVDPRAWDKHASIDTGKHRIAFSAAGYKTTTRTFDASEGVLVEIDMPTMLEKEDAPSPSAASASASASASPSPSASPPSDRRARIGWIAGGTGLLFLGAGTYFGASAIGHRADSDAECPANQCSVRGVELNDRASTEAWLANIGIGVGIVATGVGLYLLITNPATRRLGATSSASSPSSPFAVSF